MTEQDTEKKIKVFFNERAVIGTLNKYLTAKQNKAPIAEAMPLCKVYRRTDDPSLVFFANGLGSLNASSVKTIVKEVYAAPLATLLVKDARALFGESIEEITEVLKMCKTVDDYEEYIASKLSNRKTQPVLI